MSRVTVLVYCPKCVDGTKPDHLMCGTCNGLGHIAVNRNDDGTCPAEHIEWMPPILPLLPPKED